ncbi:hypothetical protein [Bacillus sp. ISL-46]
MEYNINPSQLMLSKVVEMAKFANTVAAISHKKRWYS